MKIKDNYLPEETFKELQKTILGDKFPWYKAIVLQLQNLTMVFILYTPFMISSQ